MSKKEKEEGKESIKHDQPGEALAQASDCLLYTSDAADE